MTGIGPISSLGNGRSETWDSIINLRLNLVNEQYNIDGEEWGEFFLHKMREFSIKDFELPNEGFRFIRELRTVQKEDLDLYYFLAVIKLALDDSNLQYDSLRNDVGLIMAHENPGIEIFFEELIDVVYAIVERNKGKKISKLKLAQELYTDGCEDRGYNLQTFSYLFSAAKIFNFHGYSLFINNACASGIFAIEVAAQRIRAGTSSVMVVAAVDNPTKIYKYLWFKKRGLYSADGLTKPFSNDSSGIVFGDGGAALVLEDLEHARQRGAPIYGEYLGGGFSLEGWKITVPNIAEDFYAQSFQKALNASGVSPDEIDFVNPHGVGTRITDAYEAATINKIFEDRKPPISAFKPLCGHNLGGSGLIETALTLLSLKNNCIPPTLNVENVNEDLKLNIVKKHMPIALDIVAKMSCGFAGFNGVCIFRKINL